MHYNVGMQIQNWTHTSYHNKQKTQMKQLIHEERLTYFELNPVGLWNMKGYVANHNKNYDLEMKSQHL